MKLETIYAAPLAAAFQKVEDFKSICHGQGFIALLEDLADTPIEPEDMVWLLKAHPGYQAVKSFVLKQYREEKVPFTRSLLINERAAKLLSLAIL